MYCVMGKTKSGQRVWVAQHPTDITSLFFSPTLWGAEIMRSVTVAKSSLALALHLNPNNRGDTIDLASLALYETTIEIADVESGHGAALPDTLADAPHAGAWAYLITDADGRGFVPLPFLDVPVIHSLAAAYRTQDLADAKRVLAESEGDAWRIVRARPVMAETPVPRDTVFALMQAEDAEIRAAGFPLG